MGSVVIQVQGPGLGLGVFRGSAEWCRDTRRSKLRFEVTPALSIAVLGIAEVEVATAPRAAASAAHRGTGLTGCGAPLRDPTRATIRITTRFYGVGVWGFGG